MTGSQTRRLVSGAIRAAGRAYCPYSGFRVGAALLGANGRIYTGCNVENASYGLTVCAERAALFSAVASGARRFQAIAVAAGGRRGGNACPCGACRQVLAEFCGPELPVFIAAIDRPDSIETTSLGALLPDSFKLRRRRKAGAST
jgi:cytidine deaminase